MTRRNALPHEQVYARIGRSRVHGVGVIAIRDIPKGTYMFPNEDERVVWVPRAKVRRLAPEFRALYEDFGMLDGERLGVPRSFNRLSVGWYLNHSGTPNCEADADGRFFALRHIRAGEELTADYHTFANEPLAFRAKRANGRAKRRARA